VTPGCSRKVELKFDSGLLVNRLRLKAHGTVGDHIRFDRDVFRYELR